MSSSSPAVDNATFFSTPEFVSIWTRVFAGSGKPMRVTVTGSGPTRMMYGSQVVGRLGFRTISLAPGDFFASPGWDGVLERATLDGIVAALSGPRTRYIRWTIRYDHGALVPMLEANGFVARQVATHVLPLDGDHQHAFARYNATMRNQVRKSLRSGVVVRDARSSADVEDYYRIHRHVVESKENWSFVYPIEYFREVLKLAGTARLLLAEYQGKIVAGGLFYRDGSSVMHGHASTDRQFSHVFPNCAVVDTAIQWATEIGATTFNFGASNGIASLEKYKEYWGAKVQHNWAMQWWNPTMTRLVAWRHAIARAFGN